MKEGFYKKLYLTKKISLNNPFSAPVFNLETTASTMLDARTLAAQNEPHGTVVVADVQEAGRGRIANRPWKAQKGQNLLFTILLRYSGIASIPPALTLRTGLALSLAIEDFAPALKGSLRVKWPNDVMIPPLGKAAGILTEGDGKTVYIGIGVNVGQREFPEDIRNKAASIALALGRPLEPDSRFRLLEVFLNRLHAELEEPSRQNGDWQERLGERLYMKDQQVRFLPGAADSGRVVEGRLWGIGPGGELLLKGQDGAEPESFITGELEVY
ncbi:biotin--[acetyl-CoA-carboxylase] ligase [Treponema primitia]|uniref:biotin--[acetyl-CoA-carboxylase] ligase n=1 Tax=Treponema primitia TaxID=88058 RepID=UPI00397FDA6A